MLLTTAGKTQSDKKGFDIYNPDYQDGTVRLPGNISNRIHFLRLYQNGEIVANSSVTEDSHFPSYVSINGVRVLETNSNVTNHTGFIRLLNTNLPNGDYVARMNYVGSGVISKFEYDVNIRVAVPWANKIEI